MVLVLSKFFAVMLLSIVTFADASADVFLAQLNARIERIKALEKASHQESLSPQEKMAKRQNEFLKKIQDQVSPREYQEIKAELEASRNMDAGKMNEEYERKIASASNKLNPEAKEQLLKLQNSFQMAVTRAVEKDEMYASAVKASHSSESSIQPQVATAPPEVSPAENFEPVKEEGPVWDPKAFAVSFSDESGQLRPEDYELQEYTHDRFDLQPNEDDSLFSIVSKAYKRNIPRINRLKVN